MNEQKERPAQLVDDLKEYLNVRLKIFTLTICEASSKVLASCISNGTMLFFIFLFLFFGSMAAGFGLGEWLGSMALGFIIVACFYLLLALIIWLTKAKLIEKPLVNAFIKLFLKNLPNNEVEEDEKN